MSVLVLPKRASIADGILFEEVVVNAHELKVSAAAGRPFERINGKRPVIALHQVLRAVIDTCPQYLQLSIDHRTVACPIKVCLVNLAVLYLGRCLLPFRMT